MFLKSSVLANVFELTHQIVLSKSFSLIYEPVSNAKYFFRNAGTLKFSYGQILALILPPLSYRSLYYSSMVVSHSIAFLLVHKNETDTFIS